MHPEEPKLRTLVTMVAEATKHCQLAGRRRAQLRAANKMKVL
jgi:hypothetical protein